MLSRGQAVLLDSKRNRLYRGSIGFCFYNQWPGWEMVSIQGMHKSQALSAKKQVFYLEPGCVSGARLAKSNGFCSCRWLWDGCDQEKQAGWH